MYAASPPCGSSRLSSQSAMLVFSPNGVKAHSRRGLVLFRPLTRSHRFRLSMGGSGGVAAAALSSCAGTPARWQKVENLLRQRSLWIER